MGSGKTLIEAYLKSGKVSGNFWVARSLLARVLPLTVTSVPKECLLTPAPRKTEMLPQEQDFAYDLPFPLPKNHWCMYNWGFSVRYHDEESYCLLA
jgi:hypothetical protein